MSSVNITSMYMASDRVIAEHNQAAEQARAKLMYHTKCYHAQRGYRSQRS